MLYPLRGLSGDVQQVSETANNNKKKNFLGKHALYKKAIIYMTRIMFRQQARSQCI